MLPLTGRRSERSARRHAWRLLCFCLQIWAAIVLCQSSVASVHAGETAYKLGPEDKIRLKVFEWRASQDQIFEWKALNDEFIVSASGMLFVPLVGEVLAQGQAPGDVARTISERLMERMALAAPPDTSVDIVQYRPFFVSGDVAHPGPYPYHPGLTVLEAVAIAGGLPPVGDFGLVRLDREIIGSEGELTQLAHQSDAMLVRLQRLQAEVADLDAFGLPSRLQSRRSDPPVMQLLQSENQIFQARRQAFRTQSDALKQLKVYLAKEIDSINAQLGTLDTQMQLINKELTGVSSLVEKGMAIAPRQMALERSVAQIQGDRLAMQTSLLRVQEEISKADIALIELRNNRTTEASIELRDTQLKLDEIASKSEVDERLLYETEVTAPKLVAGRLRRSVVEPTYSIIRQVDGQTSEIPASESTSMEAGDTVKVTRPLPSTMIEEANTAASPARATTPLPSVR